MKISIPYTIVVLSLYCNVFQFVNCQTVTTTLPAIKCESFTVEPQPDQVACPNAHEMVAIAVGHSLNQLVYANQWINATETSPYPDTVRKEEMLPLLGECEYDCDQDSDCAPGLLCADAHKRELKAKRLDQRKANCNRYNSGKWNEEVCFRKEVLSSGYRSLLRGNEENGEHDELEEEQNQNQNHRELACNWKCLSICVNSNAPACLVLNCANNCDRRSRHLEVEAEQGHRQVQATTPTPVIDSTALTTLATSKLRELANDPTITSKDDVNCQNFLLTATCSVDSSL